jgi:S-adenosylmethionine:tRNA ribosyltransferase-isomerase
MPTKLESRAGQGSASPLQFMDISLFDYTYPQELVAQEPLEQRDASRLMVLDRKSRSWEHRKFTNILSYFGKNDVLVFNDVRVFPSRLFAKTEGARKIEVLLLDQESELCWNCFVKPARKLVSGEKLFFEENIEGIAYCDDGNWSITFEQQTDIQKRLARIGFPPLPPYIKREHPDETRPHDSARYQTVYANEYSAAAAPTAGFHFTQSIMQALQEKGVSLSFVTLHVGRDTFQPVRAKDITEHRMHGEKFSLTFQVADILQNAKQTGKKITAVGTTTVRVLESAWNGQAFRSGVQETKAFFYPGYEFQVVDHLMTNFHQPKSTLMMLVSAFAGREFVIEAYQEAIRERYRLFSYGDAMLLL